MAFNSSFITCTVSLHFPQETSEIISSAIRAIAEASGNSYIIEKKIPPHVTVGAFHLVRTEEGRLIQLVEDFFGNQKPGVISFKEIGSFKGKVLFLKLEKSGFLEKMNRELHELLLPQFEKAENGYYLPLVWFPHTTLATRLNQSQFEKAKEIAGKIQLPLEASVNEVSLYQRSPPVWLWRGKMK